MSFRSNLYSMTKVYSGFGRSDLRGGTQGRPLIIPLETARKCGLDKPFDVVVEDAHNRIPVCQNSIDLGSVTGGLRFRHLNVEEGVMIYEIRE